MSAIFRSLALLVPFWRRALGSSALAAAAVASNVGLLAIAGYLLGATALKQPLVLLSLPIYAVRLLGITRAAARYAERVTAHDVTFRILARLRWRVYDRLAALGPLPALELHSGDALQRFVGDVDALQDLYLRSLSPVTVALLIAALVAAVLGTVSTTLIWVILAYLAVSGIMVPVLVAWLSRGKGREEAAVRGTLHTALVDGIQGLPDLLAAGRGQDLAERVRALGRGLHTVERRLARVSGFRVAVGDLLAHLATWTAIVLTVPLVASGHTPVSGLLMVAFLVLGSFEATQPLGLALQSLGHVRASAARVFAVTDALPAVPSPSDPLPLPAVPHLSFDRVTCRYAPDASPAVSDLTFDLAPGTCTAVVGPSGAGKTSLLRLALRVLDPTAGSVCLNGRDLRSFRPVDVWSLAAVVDQRTHIFNDTARANLRVGSPSADDAALWSALEAAHLAETVRRLPAGLDTWVGEQGVRLSGGERQRLAVARALLRDSPILMLDEPTANLDRLTERGLLQSLDGLVAERTVLWITHRLVDMERMDTILVMDAGRIVQRGSHAELLREAGMYRRLWEIQENVLPG